MPPKSFVFYRGPSVLDGAPIIGIATVTRSDNQKTGQMAQTFIMRADMGPSMAAKIGADASICGACPHTGKHDSAGNLIPKTRTCYVVLHHAPRSVHEAFARGVYDDLTADLDAAAEQLRGRAVRLGTYGDPAAIPLSVWTTMLAHADGLTGYTHQWRAHPAFSAYVMASCDSHEDRAEARALGFRTFRVAAASGWKKAAGETLCPASAEAGKKTSCIACKACGGLSAKARADIVIPAHGNGKKLIG